MGGASRLTAALATASAFSALPSAFYHRIAEASGTTWTTALLFASHGVACILAMSVCARSGPRLAGVPRARIVSGLLLADAVGSAFLVLAPEPEGTAMLLAGRLVTGAALGALTPLVTESLAGARGGTVLATAAVFGGVGAGSLAAGLFAAAGATRSAVFAVGTTSLVIVALLVRSATPPPQDSPARPGPATAAMPVAVCAALAFAANGVLGLFTSTLPGVIAARSAGSVLVAGATAGIVMLAAGAARLAVRSTGWRLGSVIGGCASAGTLLFLLSPHSVDGLATITALAGGALLGAAAGLSYDAALRGAAEAVSARDRLRSVAHVQRGGHLGLVLPVLGSAVVLR